jgi:AcrR family transcriptional regulator
MTGRGRSTSDSILSAARTAFGEVGYDRATIRGIAGSAGVDPALVHHYFGTKADLYAAAIELPVSPRRFVPQVLAGDRRDRGERVARAFFTIWEDPKSREPFLAMLRGAVVGNEKGTAAFREFMSHGVLSSAEKELRGRHARLRLELALSHLVGIAVLRYVVGVEPIARMDVDEIVSRVGPVIQGYLE